MLASQLGAAPSAPKPVIKNTKGPVRELAMDGPLVAYDVVAEGAECNKLFVWNVNTGGGALMSGAGTCEADNSSTGGGVTEIAVAGKRVAWIVNGGGNSESNDVLYSSSLPKPKERRLASARRTGDVGGGGSNLTGRWIAGLVGDGEQIAVNAWRTYGGKLATATLNRIGQGGLTKLAGGPTTLDAAAADGGRIAVRRADGTVALYSSAGKELRTIPTGQAKEVGLQGNRLVVLVGKTLVAYEATTGAKRRSVPVPGTAHGLDVHAGIALYAVARTLRAVELASGRDVVVATARAKIQAVALEAAGAVYSYSTGRGNVAFLSFPKVSAALD